MFLDSHKVHIFHDFLKALLVGLIKKISNLRYKKKQIMKSQSGIKQQ